MARLSIPHLFRAEGAVTPWFRIHRMQKETGQMSREIEERRLEMIKNRAVDIQLRWSCWDVIGVPFEPFDVWFRTVRDELEAAPVEVIADDDGLVLDLPVDAGVVEVNCEVINPAAAVAAFGRRSSNDLHGVIAADATRRPGGGRVTLRLRGSGMDSVLLVNGRDPVVKLEPISRIINDPTWEHLERVGLPVDGRWTNTAYDHSEQGLIASPVDPIDAAMERVARGRPPIGWWPATDGGAIAPLWEPVDPKLMVVEVMDDLMPLLDPIFENGMAPTDQHQVVDRRRVNPPRQGTNQSSAATTAALPPLGLLLLAGGSEPGLALATGFGTAYGVEPSTIPDLRFGETEFLVTARYENLPFIGDVELASFVPWPGEHKATVTPAGIVAVRDGLVQPAVPDVAWRESVKVSWQRVKPTAALGRPTGTAVARYDAATLPDSESLLPRRDAGGWRTLVPTPDGSEGEPGFDRTAIVDPLAEITLGGGGRSAAYAVAAQDVFGIWSRWSDAAHNGPEPAPPEPRVISTKLDATYAGSATCPATVEVEVALDWSTRTPTDMALSFGFFPMSDPKDDPPPGLGPDGAAPPGTFRSVVSIPFSGDAPLWPTGVRGLSLDASGESQTTPGPLQGEDGRRYRIAFDVPTLDFSATQRWGVRVWARSPLLVIAGPGAWAPVAPAVIAVAASPVPILPLLPPPPPGVPLGSTPDAEGRSHVKVHWSLPFGADPAKVVVWELSEAALRQRAGLGVAADGVSAGVRLLQLRDAYDATPVGQRRSMFRRLLELPGSPHEADVALTKGSADIHLFTATTMSKTGIESAWPMGTAEAVLQAAIAPRVTQPQTPLVRTSMGTGGSITIELETKSRVPVQSFQIFRTQSVAAARAARSMGPPFAVVAAVAPPAGTDPDPETGELSWTTTWSGPFAESWDDWFVRAVAVPVDEVPVAGVRGQRSDANEPVIVAVRPSGPPDLAPLQGEFWSAAEDGVVVRTATGSSVPPTPLGPHRLRVEVEGHPALVFASLEDIPLDSGTPPTGVGTTPVVVRGPTAAGQTPLAVWFVRPDRTVAVDVAFRLADPLGRVDAEGLTVPGWQPPAGLFIDIVDVFTIAGRGLAMSLRSDAPVSGAPAGVMEIVATGSSGPRFFPRRKRLRARFALDEIPVRRGPFGRTKPIQVTRASNTSPFDYGAFIGLQSPATIVIRIRMEDGRRAESTRQIGSRGRRPPF
jgi:hypothetical protein